MIGNNQSMRAVLGRWRSWRALPFGNKSKPKTRGWNKAGHHANRPQNCLRALKINTERACRVWGDSDTFIGSINEIRNFGPLKDFEGPQIYDIKGPNDPWQFLLILTPA